MKAYTLMELLTVTAIVVVLAAITFPAFHEVRRESYRGVATSALRQAHTGILLYREDSGGYPLQNLDPVAEGNYFRSSALLKLPDDPYPEGFGTHLANCEGANQIIRTRLASSMEWVFYTDERGRQQFLDGMIRPRDPNPGLLIVRIYGTRLTGQRCSRGEFFGPYLRVREDGSAVRTFQPEFAAPGVRRTCYPALFSDRSAIELCGPL